MAEERHPITSVPGKLDAYLLLTDPHVLRLDISVTPDACECDRLKVILETFVTSYDGRVVVHVRYGEGRREVDLPLAMKVAADLTSMRDALTRTVTGLVVQVPCKDDMLTMVTGLFHDVFGSNVHVCVDEAEARRCIEAMRAYLK
jgi:hypothetical protein